MTRVTAIDFETANQYGASVCAVGISVLEEGAAESVYESLIRPEANMSRFLPGNIRIHGIYPKDVETAPSFAEVYREIRPYLEDSLVCAHNARFDMNCLRETCLNCGLPVPHLTYFDTVELSRKLFPALPHHRLNDMCDYLQIDLDHHHAGSDAYGCLMIVANVMNMAGIYDPEELLKQCRIHTYRL